ncbi:MAG: class II aldolase/adducin family protein [Burkholderiales bacterium]
MNSAAIIAMPSRRAQVSPEEWQTRVDLAAAYRLVALFKWDDLVFTHISARVSGPHEHFLINPYGLMFEEITASSLIKIDLQGTKIEDSPYPVNPAGFTIHSAVHAARHDVGCVVHTHSLNGVAVSAQREGLLPISQFSIFIMGQLGYHDYEGVALNEDEKPRLQRDLGSNKYLMLRNHGLLTVGATVAEAWLAMYAFETACTVQVRAQAGGGELIPIGRPIIDNATQMSIEATKGLGPQLVWPGLLRRLQRQLPGYDQ